ncbi:TetR/AcrR family transcriptional regulator [Gordonia bronchialis]|uniref:TetR/AcrR family transcriptional regulator n=1 Tax=Gordonia bronchialis TaxID=2054 RepID=UPI00226E4EE4|nr:TetR/AcrR family transcriptional regulator [Gordonia bronchialis]
MAESTVNDRRTSADDKIIAATLETLREKGPLAVTVERVAAVSGVARTTIYRRYADRGEMLAAALRGIGVPGAPVHPQLTCEDRLRWLIGTAGSLVVDGIGMGGVAALITDADGVFTHAFRDIVEMHHATIREALVGQQGTELAPGVSTSMLIDAVVGGLVAEYARRGAISGDWRDRMFNLYVLLVVDPG